MHKWNKTYTLIVLITLIFGQSCVTYKISSTVKKWVPYTPGQKIIFQSTKGELDTLFIMSKNYYNNPEDHLAIISTHHQKLTIDAKVPDSWINPMKTHFDYSHQTILIVDANTKSTTIDLRFKPYGYFFESSENNFDSLNSNVELEIAGKRYNDITIFNCNNEVFCSREKSINEIYWSKQFGIVQYLLGQELWSLKEIIHN